MRKMARKVRTRPRRRTCRSPIQQVSRPKTPLLFQWKPEQNPWKSRPKRAKVQHPALKRQETQEMAVFRLKTPKVHIQQQGQLRQCQRQLRQQSRTRKTGRKTQKTKRRNPN